MGWVMRKHMPHWRPGRPMFNGYCPVLDEHDREVWVCMSVNNAERLCREFNNRVVLWHFKVSVALIVLAALIAAWNTVVTL